MKIPKYVVFKVDAKPKGSKIEVGLEDVTEEVEVIDHTEKKPCATCMYHDWEWDDHIGFRNICKGIGKCPYNGESNEQ